MISSYSDLKDKKILITGATRGLGLEIAKSLCSQGAHVIYNYRKEDFNTEAHSKIITENGGKASALFFDITDSEKAKEAITAFNKEHGPISGLVNNAGISKDGLLMRLKEEDLTAILDTNLKAAMMLTSFLSRGFLKAENVSVVNVSSVVGLMGNSAQTAYAASKAGLIGFTKSVARELGSRNIRCNALCPGFIDTDMTASLTEDVKSKYFDTIPLGRFGKPGEVAEIICFLLSNASSYITGEVIKIDGGIYI